MTPTPPFASRELVARIVPYEPEHLPERDVGFLDGKVKVEFMGDFYVTESELLGVEE